MAYSIVASHHFLACILTVHWVDWWRESICIGNRTRATIFTELGCRGRCSYRCRWFRMGTKGCSRRSLGKGKGMHWSGMTGSKASSVLKSVYVDIGRCNNEKRLEVKNSSLQSSPFVAGRRCFAQKCHGQSNKERARQVFPELDRSLQDDWNQACILLRIKKEPKYLASIFHTFLLSIVYNHVNSSLVVSLRCRLSVQRKCAATISMYSNYCRI